MAAGTCLAAVITSAETPLDRQVQAARAAGADLVELRVDCIDDVDAVEALLDGPRNLPLIVTLRAADEGGSWSGDEAERIALLQRLGLHGPGYLDIEYATWQRSANVRQKIQLACGAGRTRNKLIVSHHDFTGTPADLGSLFDDLVSTPADVVKAVFTARDTTDALRVLSQLRRRARGRRLIALAMGEAGLITRVLARKFGAFLTYAALEPGEESAPGQPTLSDLRRIYRWEKTNSATRVFGVVGWPVAHSQSPSIHNAALAAADVDGVYLPLPVREAYESFATFMDTVAGEPELDVVGLSVTLPHKEHTLRWLGERGQRSTDLARRCGAVNTLTRQSDGVWVGDNTDGLGAVGALQQAMSDRKGPLRGLGVGLLGAGGVARAIAAALLDQGCAVTVYNRTPERAARLAQELRCAWRPWQERTRSTGTVLINCTSVGLWPDVDRSPVPAEALRRGTWVFDTVYRPRETRLLRAARARGCHVVDGVEMFLRQAAGQYERWHGGVAPVETMRNALAAGDGR